MNKKLKLLALLLAASTLAACGGHIAQNPSQQTTHTGTSRSAAREDIAIHLMSDISSFDPKNWFVGADFMVYQQMYDPLLRILPDQAVELVLAESYEINEDATVYTFKIRDDVPFHNGDTLRASDVAFSYEYFADGPYYYSYLDGMDKVEALDGNKVRFTLREPDATFMQAAEVVCIVSERAITEGGDRYDDNPVGTGAYRYVDYERGASIRLTRFDAYYKGPAPIRDVTFRIIPDLATATISLQAGDLDCIFDNFYDTAAYHNIQNDPNLKFVPLRQNQFISFALNHELPPFDNVLVRQAVCYAIDRELIIDTAVNGLADVATNMVAPGIFGYSRDIEMGYIYDVGQAQALIERAGLKTPMSIGAIKALETQKKEAEILRQNLAAIGLNAIVKVIEEATLMADLRAGDYSICSMGYGMTTDADFYSLLLHSDNIGTTNYARYANPRVDALFAIGKMTVDPKKRLEIYTELFKISGEEVAHVPVHFPHVLAVMSADLQWEKTNSKCVYDMSWR